MKKENATFKTFRIMACSDVPLSNVEVKITGYTQIYNFSYETFTDDDGHFSFSVGGTDLFWRIEVINPDGKTNPPSYLFLKSQGNQSGVNFQLMYKPNTYYGNAQNYSQISSYNSALNPNQKHCINSGNCLFIGGDYLDIMSEKGSTAHCFSSRLYEIRRGRRVRNLSKTTCFSVQSKPTIYGECAPYAFDIGDVINDPNNIGKVIEVEITQGCCGDKGQCVDPSFTNVWSVFLKIDGITNASVDFNFNVSAQVDQNNPGDPSGDGVQPISLTSNGPALGKFTTAINATITSDEVLNSMTYNLYSVECYTGQNEELVSSAVVPLNSQGQPDNFSFANFKDSNGNVYFVDDNNHVGKCFKVECVASNDCGDVNAYSYFTIDPNVYLDEEGDIEGRNTSAFNLTIYPNPVKNHLHLSSLHFKQEVGFQIFNTKGVKVLEDSINGETKTIDVSNLNQGVYYIRYHDKMSKILKFVKL